MKYSIILICIIIFASCLRIYKVDTLPPGLYVDEVDIGYNAYTILTRGVDEHGTRFPLFFSGYGDYKLPVYIYLTAISVFFLGNTDLAVRSVSILSGIGSIIVFYFFTRSLLSLEKKLSKSYVVSFSLLATFLLTISPWHFHLSRAGFELVLAFFFYITGSWLFLLFYHRKSAIFFYLSLLCYALTIYTYNSYRIVSVITVFVLFYITYRYVTNKRRRHIAFAGIVLFVLAIAPMIITTFSPQGYSRFIQTSAFSPYSQRSIQEKIMIFPIIYIRNYLSYFSVDFLFNHGDGFGRHQFPNFGVFYLWQLPFLVIGLWRLLQDKKYLLGHVILFLLFVSVIPGAFTLPSPHILRSFLLNIPLLLLVSYGLMYSIKKLYAKKIFFCLVGIISCYQILYYFHTYFVHYPITNEMDWGGAWKTTVDTLRKYKQYPIIVIDRDLNFAGATYVHYYTKGTLDPIMISLPWEKPKEWKNKRVLFITKYNHKNKDTILDTVYLKNINHDIFAQFIEK